MCCWVPTGCGKSTLLYLIRRPGTGNLAARSGRSGIASPGRRRAQPDFSRETSLFPWAHRGAEWRASASLSAAKGRGPQDAACEVARRVGLTERIEQRPDELSGGACASAVAVARAAGDRPKVLLRNEPFCGARRADLRAKSRILLDVGATAARRFCSSPITFDEAGGAGGGRSG